MNRRTRPRWAGASAAALGAGVLLIGPTTVLAQSDDDTTTTTQAPATDDEATTPPAVPSWIQDVLDALVAAGTLTQAQADAVTNALQEARPAHGPFGPGGHWHHGPGRFGARIALSTAADAIGISEDELRDALRDGQTLAEIADAHDVTAQAVIDALVADAKERLDQAVADGDVDQAEADERLSDITDRITTAVNEGFPGRGMWRDHDKYRDDSENSDDATTTTEPKATTTTTAGGS